MRLKLDENLGKRGVLELEAAGHDVATVASQQLWGSPDFRIIEVCREEQRALVTLDLDFGNPLVFDPRRYPGIAVFRLPRRPTPAHLSEAVETLIGALNTRELAGNLWIVERARIREYQPDEERP